MKATKVTGTVRDLIKQELVEADSELIMAVSRQLTQDTRRRGAPINHSIDLREVVDQLKGMSTAQREEITRLLAAGVSCVGADPTPLLGAMVAGILTEMVVVHRFPKLIASDLVYLSAGGKAAPALIADDEIDLALPAYMTELLFSIEQGTPIDLLDTVDSHGYKINLGKEEPTPEVEARAQALAQRAMESGADELEEADGGTLAAKLAASEASGATPEELEQMFEALTAATKH